MQRAARSTAQSPRPERSDPSTLRRYRIRQRLGDEDTAELLRAYAAGDSAKALAQRFGISRQSVNVLAEEAGLPRRLRRLTEHEEDQIVQLYDSGLGQGAVAKKLGLGKSTVQAVLRRRHVKVRNGSARTAEHD